MCTSTLNKSFFFFFFNLKNICDILDPSCFAGPEHSVVLPLNRWSASDACFLVLCGSELDIDYSVSSGLPCFSILVLFFSFKLKSITPYLLLYMWMHVYICHSTHVIVRRQFIGVGPVLSPCGSWGMELVTRLYVAAPFLDELLANLLVFWIL